MIRARRRGAVLALALLLPLLAAVPISAGAGEPSSRRAAQGSLSVSPSVYVPGQALRFTGKFGKPGKRTAHLQVHMNRPGDVWEDVLNGPTFRTNNQGSFAFVFPAPSMFGVSYRAVSAGLVTRAVPISARPQEITLTLEGESAGSPFYDVNPLVPFTVVADTTPDGWSQHGTPPAFPNRTVNLQERVSGNQWRTIATRSTDANGDASFVLTAPLAGQRVLRARQERWTEGQNEIGWYASFPAYFDVLGLTPRTAAAPPTSARAPSTQTAKTAARPTASERYKWGAARFDFNWERGQDLTTAPSRGTKLKGQWIDTSDGTGRATPLNGGLMLQSKLSHGGPGDLGTTTATLKGNAQGWGRWEFRLQGYTYDSGDRPYRFRLELVPERAPVTTCLPASVVVADFTLGAPGMGVGVRSKKANSVWGRRLGAISLNETPFNVAVEVGKKHVTWFRDGEPVAKVKGRKSQLGVKLVPRFSLIGGQQEMNGAQVHSDWQRAWPLKAGKQVKKGPKLTRAAYSATC